MSKILVISHCHLTNLTKMPCAYDALSHHMAVVDVNTNKVSWLSLQTDDCLVGCVYMGVVVRIVPELSCVFVDIGRPKNGLLPFEEMAHPIGYYYQGAKVIVQVKRNAIGDKGAHLTSKICLQSVHMFYRPLLTAGIHISHKIKHKKALKQALGQIWQNQTQNQAQSQTMGDFIVRTSADTWTANDLLKEMQALANIWQNIQKARTSCYKKKHHLLYRAPAIFLLNHVNDVDCIQSDDAMIINHLQNLPILANIRADFVYSQAPLYEHFALQNVVQEILSPRVTLASGAYIVIEKTEAMTVIDVNSGKQICMSAYDINLEVAYVIVEQLQLRQIGGMVIIDFISMSPMDYDHFFIKFQKMLSGLASAVYKVAMGLVLLNMKQI